VTGLLVVSIIGRDSHRWASELRVNKGWVDIGFGRGKVEAELLHSRPVKRRKVGSDVVVAHNSWLEAHVLGSPLGHCAHLAVVGLRRSNGRRSSGWSRGS
jgi:hypothetical protein